MPIGLRDSVSDPLKSTSTTSHDSPNMWSPLEHAHRASWHANTAIDNTLAVRCPSLSSAVQRTFVLLEELFCNAFQPGCNASVHRARAPGSLAASSPSQFAAEPPTNSASVGTSDATLSLFELGHFNLPHVAMRAVTAVCCFACGSDPYLQQRVSSMKLLLRHTHAQLALRGVSFARLQLAKLCYTCLLLVACGNKLGPWSFQASGECVHTISSYKANAHCRLRRWRRRESGPRFERRRLALQHPSPAVWRGSQHRQDQQGIGGSEASAHQDTGSSWA